MYSQVRTVAISDTPRCPPGGAIRRRVYRHLLTQGGKSTRQLAEALGLTPKQVRRALACMVRYGDVVPRGGRYMVRS